MTRNFWSDPLLRWAGSKRKLLPELISHVPAQFGRYVEPFAGSGCLFFALKPAAAVLGDINADLIDTYKTIRTHPRLVARAAHAIKRDSRTYYAIRDLKRCDLTIVQRAARFVYLNRNCFNGVYRINREGKFNVPIGTRTGSLAHEAEFYRHSIALRNADLRAMDYRKCLADVRRDDFVYLDPPYASRRRNTHGEYGYDCFSEADLPSLFATLLQIDTIGATFLLSYSSHNAFHDLPRGWFRRRLLVRRHVAGFARHRRGVYEILVSNRPLTPTSGSLS